jgi:hypothetical protein
MIGAAFSTTLLFAGVNLFTNIISDSMVDLLIKLACSVKKENDVLKSKSS